MKANQPFRDDVQLKRERGESLIHPAVAPVSLCERFVHCGQIPTGNLRLGGQNLAALGTAASQNLTTIGSSHSLTETVNLGTMTTAGLIGTLHEVTPPVISRLCSTVFRPQQHILKDHNWSCYGIIAEKCKKVNLFFGIYLIFREKTS